MVRLLSSKAQGLKDFRKTSKPGHVGTHWIALAEYYHMSTHVPGFQSFFRLFASFYIGQISQQRHEGLKCQFTKFTILEFSNYRFELIK